MKLNDTQLIILSSASTRENRAVLPLPKSLKLGKEETSALLQGLIRKKLIAEWPAMVHEPVWREKGDQHFTLVITDNGLEALGIEPEEVKSDDRTLPAVPVKPTLVKSPVKKPDIVLTLLSRAKGATIEQLQEATGWQPHSIRAVISGLRKRGMTVSRLQTKDGVSLYRVGKA